MEITTINKNNISIALVKSDTIIITDVQSALDLIMSVKYETKSTNIAINKEAITENFFILSTCLAGKILQKFINYGIRIAIYGDYSKYTSKPLKDFIYESNNGKDVFFQPDLDSAIDKLCFQTNAL